MNDGIRERPDDLAGKQLYHGTRATLSPGDTIAPGNASSVVFLSPKLDEAIWDAELAVGEGPGRVYILEPNGEITAATEVTDWKPPGHPTMSWCSRKPLRVIAEVTQWMLYHGTRADLNPGDLIQPGFRSNFGKRTQSTHVYFARTLDAATWGAELAVGDGRGRIYSVEPTGPIESDPELTNQRFRGNPTQSYRSSAPLRVTGEVKEWSGHSPAAVQAMKDALKRLDT